MGLTRFLCFLSKSNKVIDGNQITPKKHLQSWVMDFQMADAPKHLTQKEILYIGEWKKEFTKICMKYGESNNVKKIQTFVNEYNDIYKNYTLMLRDDYQKNNLIVDAELLKLPAIRKILGLKFK